MKHWREITSTSPGGRHLGHYKILFYPINNSLSAKKQQELQAILKVIAQYYLNLINYATKHKDSFKLWKTIINMILYK